MTGHLPELGAGGTEPTLQARDASDLQSKLVHLERQIVVCEARAIELGLITVCAAAVMRELNDGDRIIRDLADAMAGGL